VSLTKSINKKRNKEAREPHARNPIYLKPINCLGCHFSHSAGRKRKFKNLWRLYMHYTEEHTNENYKESIMQLADLVMKGVLI